MGTLCIYRSFWSVDGEILTKVNTLKFYGSTPPLFPGALKRGDNGSNVKELQEWLTLQKKVVTIDGDFGPATERALFEFSSSKSLGFSASRVLTASIWEALTTPITNALHLILPQSFLLTDVGKIISYIAGRHYELCAREVGGENCGPWVRLYTQGQEGKDWAWCAGFTSFILKQTKEISGRVLQFPYSLSCDTYGLAARKQKALTISTEMDAIPAGSIFLINKSQNDWIHTGFVVDSDKDTIVTIEGNTNVAGSREGIAVMKRIRARKSNIHIIATPRLFY